MRVKAISALTVFTTVMIMAFAGSHPAESGLSSPGPMGDAYELEERNARLAA